MKEEKKLKEIVIRQNSGIVFPKNEGVNGDILILGNFNGICGEVTWHGIGNSSFEDNNFYNFESTFVTNISVLMDTLNAGNRIFIVGSKDTISYFKDLLYTIADTFMFDMSAKKRKKMFNRQVWAIDTTELYERTFVKYNSTSEHRKEAADKAIHNIVTNKIFERIKHMKFDYIIQNPPYNKSLHLAFLEKGLDLLSEQGKMVIIEPATWLINVRKYGKRNEMGRTCSSEIKKYDELKKRLDGHVESVVIENRNKDFDIENYVPFATTVIDFSKTYREIEFICCGEKKIVKSLYDCNLIGDYNTVWSILNKIVKYGDMMHSHYVSQHDNKVPILSGVTYNTFVEGQFPHIGWHSKSTGAYGNNGKFRETKDGKYFEPYVRSLSDDYVGAELERGKNNEENLKPAVFGSEEDIANWKYNVRNLRLLRFLPITLIYDQNHNNIKDFTPWLVDKQYTDEEINKMFGFTDEEIALIDRTIKKYERNSPWFKRYMCGPDSVSDEEVNNFTKTLDE